MSQGFKNN